MFYWYNSATQKIVTPSSIQSAIFAPNATQLNKPKQAGKAICQTKVPMRMMSSKPRLVPGTDIPYPKLDPKYVALCKKFQEPNGLPIHLKGGPGDAILIKVTGALIIVGVIMQFAWVAERYNKRG